VTLSLRFGQDEAMSQTWRITGAELQESGVATWGLLKIENISKARIRYARFYADYYDRGGRRCFTLVFATERHSERPGEDAAPFAPGERRELLSDGVAPASEPVEVRVRLVSQKAVGQPEQTVAGDSIVRSPVTVRGTGLDLKFALRPSERQQPVVDLAFAKIDVDASGQVEKWQILGALNADAKDWLERFIQEPLQFQPAAAAFKSTSSPAFVLVRIVRADKRAEESAFLPRQSPWVKAYARTQDRELQPITQLLFTETADGALTFLSAGSSWSSEIVRRDWDGASRQWRMTWRSTDAAQRHRAVR
jgi:hypothetical protein